MHRLGIVAAACALLLLGIVFPGAQPFSSFPPGTFNSRAALNPAPGGGGFTGPIDINGTAFAFWSTRCGATAYTGNVYSVWDAATGSTTHTLVTCSSGGVLNETINSLATTCLVSCNVDIIYDQSGSLKCTGVTACNITAFGTNANRPLLTTNCQNSKACVVFLNTSANCFTSPVLSATQAQPFTVSHAIQTSGGATDHTIFENSTNGNNIAARVDSSVTAQTQLYAGLTAVAAASANALHATQGLFNGASSSLYVDGSSTTGLNASTAGFVAANINVGASKNGGGTDCAQAYLKANFFEFGIWAGDKTANNATMNSNQHTYWSF